jgi:nitrogen regulatory protein P-II 2
MNSTAYSIKHCRIKSCQDGVLFYFVGWRKLTVTKGDSMKFVTAILRPHQLDNVREALLEAGVSGITVTEVKGFGRQKGHTEMYRGAEYQVDFLPKVKLEIAITASKLDEVIEVIINTANSGKVGDGKIFVANLEKVIRIRTGETDQDAL